MKTSAIHTGICKILLFITAILSQKVVLAQDQTATPEVQQDTWSVHLLYQSLSPALTDTSRPTLSNGGKGLLNCDFIFLKHQDETFLFKLGGGKNPVLVKGTFTEADLEILKNNMLFIEKQYNIQIKEWIRNDKWDLNLGEAIKGFYMKPIY